MSLVPLLASETNYRFSIGYDENVCSTYCLCQQRLALSQYSLFLSVNTKVDMKRKATVSTQCRNVQRE